MMYGFLLPACPCLKPESSYNEQSLEKIYIPLIIITELKSQGLSLGYESLNK